MNELYVVSANAISVDYRPCSPYPNKKKHDKSLQSYFCRVPTQRVTVVFAALPNQVSMKKRILRRISSELVERSSGKHLIKKEFCCAILLSIRSIIVRQFTT